MLALAAVGYVGTHVGDPYFRYYRYRDAIAQRVRFAGVRSDSTIKKEIWAAADSIGLPEEAYRLSIDRDARQLHVTGHYDDQWSVLSYSRQVPFAFNVTGSL